jgi:hypothetical protein
MGLKSNAAKFVIVGLIVGLGALSIAQGDAGGGTGVPVWQRVLYSGETPRFYYGDPFVTSPVTPGTTVYQTFTNHFNCWDSIDEDSSLTAPWSSAFSATYTWTSISTLSGIANSDGIVTIPNYWEDSTEAEWRNGYERWLYNPTNKKKERRTSCKIISTPGGGGGGAS